MLPSQRNPWQDPRIAGVLLMVFLVGAASGALTMRLGMHARWRQAPGARNGNTAAVTYDKLKKELNLTPDQADRIKSILDDMVAYREDIESQAESFRATGKQRILSILTPVQRQRFEQISSELPDR